MLKSVNNRLTDTTSYNILAYSPPSRSHAVSEGPGYILQNENFKSQFCRKLHQSQKYEMLRSDREFKILPARLFYKHAKGTDITWEIIGKPNVLVTLSDSLHKVNSLLVIEQRDTKKTIKKSVKAYVLIEDR